VWGETLVSEEGLRDYLREIRQALGDNAKAPRFIETVHRRGYRFLPTVTTQPVPSAKLKVQSAQSPPPGAQHPAPILVGRGTELAQLHRWFDKAMNGKRQIVFVTGEPGIGKTTLIDAFYWESGAGSQGFVPPPNPQALIPKP
jgi:transcriptional regulator of acetoin/glycerol metabolism